jgi:hypothetical protein
MTIMSNQEFGDEREDTPAKGVPPVPPNAKPNGEDVNGLPIDAEASSVKPANKGAKTKARKPSAEPEPETTFERAESLPDETQAAPEPSLLQEADDLDDLLSGAIAPDDEDVDLAEMELGQADYSTIARRTSPPQMIPIRIFPKSVGTTTVYLLTVKREAQGEGDLDTYMIAKPVRERLAGHPVFQKAIRRFQIRLGVTSLGVPFFLEINLDDHGIWGQSRRDLVAIAETKWLTVTSDRQAGYRHWDSDHFEDPVQPKQSFEELYKLTYKPCLITTLDHPVIKRGMLRKAAKS